jgi:hypothetical protein
MPALAIEYRADAERLALEQGFSAKPGENVL